MLLMERRLDVVVGRGSVTFMKKNVSRLKFGKIKVDKNEAFQRCHLNIFHNIDNIYDSVGFLERIDGG